MRNRMSFAVFSSLLLTLLSVANPASAQQIKTSVSSEIVYPASSSQAAYLKQWLYDHAEYRNGSLLGDFSALGKITVKVMSHFRSAAFDSGNGPPVPLPTTGQNGDTISVSSCGGGASQTWSYVWAGGAGGGWVLMSYSFVRTTSCSRSGA